MVLALEGEMKRSEIQQALKLNNRENFLNTYLNPTLEQGYIEMKYPDTPNHPRQNYRLTPLGISLRNKLTGK